MSDKQKPKQRSYLAEEIRSIEGLNHKDVEIRDNAARQVEIFEEDELRFYHADGSYDTLDSAEEVTVKRIECAKEMVELRAELATQGLCEMKASQTSNPNRRIEMTDQPAPRDEQGPPATSISKLDDLETRLSKSGNEYAVIPQCDPRRLEPFPHGWMSVVNGHLGGQLYQHEADAWEYAETLASTPATNARDMHT